MAASWPQSENKLPRPRPKTPVVSHRFEVFGDEVGGEVLFILRIDKLVSQRAYGSGVEAGIILLSNGATLAAMPSAHRSRSSASSHKTGPRN